MRNFSVKKTPVLSKLLAITLMTLVAPLALSAPASSRAQDKKSKSEQSSRQPQQPDDEPLRLHSDLVVVNVTVTDDAGKYAHGLTAKDFAILEDGAPQALSSFASEEAPFAAAVLIDMSGSMEYKFGLVRAAAASFVDHIRDDDQVAVYGFNNKIRQFQEFTNVRDISEYVWDAKPGESTRMYDCMDEALAALEKREERRRTMLLISDGCDTMSGKASLNSVMKRALAAGVMIYSIDLIDDSALSAGSESAALRRGRAEMQQFATESGGRYVHSPQGDKLEEAFTKIVDELRNQYTLSYYSTNKK